MHERPLHALTVDVEDYFHVEAFARQVRREGWDSYPLRVVESTQRLLDLFDRHAVKATFFVLGWVARQRPALVAEIARRGHELGCHSSWHRLVYAMTPDELRTDLREATRAIEDAGGRRLEGYRAPSYSVTRRSSWALEALAEAGYAYDSSIFPIRHDIYGWPEFPRQPVRVELAGGASIVEFPPSTVRLAGRNLPGPGGGYLRIFPLAYARWALRRIESRDGWPGTVYLHPWEVDPDQPRLAGPLKSRLRHYTNLRRTESRLASLLAAFRFAPMGEVLRARPPARSVRLADLAPAGTPPPLVSLPGAR